MHYICPNCQCDQLYSQGKYYACEGCQERYRIIYGIPDFRTYPFPYSDSEGVEVRTLLESYDRLDFVGLCRLRFGFFLDNGKTEKELQRVHDLHEASLKSLVDYHMDHSDIFSMNLKRFRHIIGKKGAQTEGSALELGAGRGTQIPDMLSLYRNVVAMDNSMAEMILTKKLLEQKGLLERVQLVCACSESIPFLASSFDAGNMRSVLEHVEDQQRSIREIHRVLRGGGILLLESPNRFTFRREPHVKVYGVGFVPRRWMKGYVDLVTGRQLTYEGIRNLSYFELRRLLRKTFGTTWEHRVRVVDEARGGVTLVGKLYRRFGLVKRVVENVLTKFFCQTHYVAAWKE